MKSKKAAPAVVMKEIEDIPARIDVVGSPVRESHAPTVVALDGDGWDLGRRPTVKLTQQQLEAHLWGAANILRGKTAGQDYKNYILSLLEGILISSYAIKSHVCYIYIRGEFVFGARRLEEQIAEAYAKGYLGKNIFGTGYDLDVYVHRGAGAYICGEETGLIESLEGKRAYPRIKPPFPAVYGLFGCPTIVNNVETLACVPMIIEKGAQWFKSIGPESGPGPKLFCVSGHVEKPGLYELPMGIPLRTLLYDHCGGIRGGKKLKAVMPGGSPFPLLTPDQIDAPMDFDSMRKINAFLGSAGVIVMDEDTCMVKALEIIDRFYHHESCGQCSPCREGTGWLHKLLTRLEEGNGKLEDIELMDKISTNMTGNTVCVLADAAAMPTQSFLSKFKDEFVAHVTLGRCPFKKEGSVPRHHRHAA